MATGTVQRATFVGRVSKMPAQTTLDTGRVETRFDIASHFFGMRNGKPAEKIDFFTVVCYERFGEFARKFLRTGSLVYIEGHISRIFQDIEIVCRDLQVFGACLICNGKPKHCETCSCSAETVDRDEAQDVAQDV